MLVQTASRYREAGVRMALGASRGSLFGLVLKEALVLVTIGGGLGLLLAQAGLKGFVAAAPVDLPRLQDVHMDWRVLAFTGVAVMLCSMICGLFPAWRLSRTQPQQSLKSGSANSTESGRKLRFREVMVGVEVALSTVLLIVGGLLMLSFYRLMRVDKGFEVEHIVTQGVSLISPKYRQDGAQTRFIDRVLPKIEAIPGVRSAGVTNQIPLQGETWVDGLVDPTGPVLNEMRTPNANFRFVSPDYWKTMGIPLQRGRFIEVGDRHSSTAILSERAARLLWPGQDPIGKSVRGTGNTKPRLEVVGVVADVREGLANQAPLMVYQPYWTMDLGGPSFVLRTQMDPAGVIRQIHAIVSEEDPEIPLTEAKTMEQILTDSVALRRFQMYLAVAFAFTALVLASLGIYGVIAFTVARRTSEMGIRIALGARAAQIVTMIVRQGMLPVGLGLAAGVATALLVSGLIAAQLYGVTAHDPVTISAVTLLLLAVAMCACWIPARRATKVDPLRALRFE
jgi:putative ABC transport system permease protein